MEEFCVVRDHGGREMIMNVEPMRRSEFRKKIEKKKNEKENPQLGMAQGQHHRA
jgi:hypothetical protein